MRREVVWAIVAGIIFGLVIAFGMVRINSTIKPKRVVNTSSPTPKTNEIGSLKITLDKPQNEDVITSDKVIVSGITKSSSWVTISGEAGDYITQSTERGVFEQEVELTPGINQIKSTVFDSQGQESSEKVLVIYSSSFEKEGEEISNHPKAYIGTVTDIADSTIQVKTTLGEIKQISTNKDSVVVVKDSGTKTTTVKFTDVAIGDFIVAMGYISPTSTKNSNPVLKSSRILITPAIKEPTIKSYLSKIVSVSKKDISITSLSDGQDKTVTPDKNTSIYLYKNNEVSKIKMTNLEEDGIMIYVNDEGEKDVTTRSIILISQ